MKRISLIVALLAVALSSNAFAVQRTATFGDKNSAGLYRMVATNDGVITFQQDTGLTIPYISTATTNTTLTAAQTGTTVVLNNGNGVAATNTMYTLPAATVGLNYSFITDVAKQFIVHPAGTDQIMYSTIPAGAGILNSSAAIGDSIEVVCLRAGKWSIKNITGTWANSNQ